MLKLLVLLLTTSISSAGEAPAPLVIEESQLGKYWHAENSAPFQRARIAGPCERGFVTVRYEIDSSGWTRDVKVLRGIPFNTFRERYVEQMLRAETFRPAPENEARRPVQVTETYRFDCASVW